jgi:hypothetical protein
MREIEIIKVVRDTTVLNQPKAEIQKVRETRNQTFRRRRLVLLKQFSSYAYVVVRTSNE